MQKLTLIGHLGRDAAVRETKNGRKFVSLTVGVNGMVNGVQKSYWYDVMWFNFNDNVVQYLKKGAGVIVVGELDADIETGTDGIARCRRNVMADSIAFNSTGTGKSQDGEQAPQTQAQTPQTQTYQAPQPPQDSVIAGVSAGLENPVVANEEETDLPF